MQSNSSAKTTVWDATVFQVVLHHTLLVMKMYVLLNTDIVNGELKSASAGGPGGVSYNPVSYYCWTMFKNCFKTQPKIFPSGKCAVSLPIIYGPT